MFAQALLELGGGELALGLDHRKLTYYYGGREQRLTNFGGDPLLKVFG